jgi:hypothetical protein
MDRGGETGDPAARFSEMVEAEGTRLAGEFYVVRSWSRVQEGCRKRMAAGSATASTAQARKARKRLRKHLGGRTPTRTVDEVPKEFERRTGHEGKVRHHAA